jgi:hypothetical protein
LRVADLLRWIDEAAAWGLDPIVAQLVVATFAEQTDRAFYVRGGEVTSPPDPGRITTDHTLREERLPSEDEWEIARQRAMAIFGTSAVALRRGRLIGMFSRDLIIQGDQYKKAARELVERLDRHARWLGIEPDAPTGRLATARAAADLLDKLDSRGLAVETIERLARAELAGPADRDRKEHQECGAGLLGARGRALGHLRDRR